MLPVVASVVPESCFAARRSWFRSLRPAREVEDWRSSDLVDRLRAASYRPNVNETEIRALAEAMTWKTALVIGGYRPEVGNRQSNIIVNEVNVDWS